MYLDREATAKIAQQYFQTDKALVPLGWGISGSVYLSPDLLTAVKVHYSELSFRQELLVYRRLAALKITELHGLTVPKLRAAHADVKLLQMDFVSAPYLLDFAGAMFDPPDFPDDKMEHWHAEIESNFGPNAHIVYAVYNTLSQHGIYYVDFRPSNLNLAGLPGLKPFNATED